MHCHCKYTPEPKQHGYPDEMRKQAVQMYIDGMNLRRIARHFGIHHRTVSLWVQASAASLPEAPVPKEVKTAESNSVWCGKMGETAQIQSPSKYLCAAYLKITPANCINIILVGG